jgi:hypothetical protein
MTPRGTGPVEVYLRKCLALMLSATMIRTFRHRISEYLTSFRRADNHGIFSGRCSFASFKAKDEMVAHFIIEFQNDAPSGAILFDGSDG